MKKKMNLFGKTPAKQGKNSQTLKINPKFRKKYEFNNKRREIERLENKLEKPDDASLISEDFESEDSCADLLQDGEIVLDFMRVYSKLKKKKADIYKEGTQFYGSKQRLIATGGLGKEASKGEADSNPGKLYNVQDQFLEEDGREEGSHQGEDEDAPVEVQRKLKAAFKAALREDDQGNR